MMKKIALLLSGNIRTFFMDDFKIAKNYSELTNNNDIDIFIYTDNNDFNYNNTQYFSEHNKNKTLGIPADINRRHHNLQQFINYNDSAKIISETLTCILGKNLKKTHIEDFDSEQINIIYDKNNINHVTFMTNNYSSSGRKTALMCQYYKLYKCYNLLVDYEKENNISYDIIIRSRFDGILTNINKYNIRSFDLTDKIYCEGYNVFMNDWWALGNRYIMEIYCNYYNNISSNMTNKTFCFDHNKKWQIVNSMNIEDFRKNTKIREDASDSAEFGLTYLIKHINNYILFYDHDIRININKFYN